VHDGVATVTVSSVPSAKVHNTTVLMIGVIPAS
jgi:hypothetical protein